MKQNQAITELIRSIKEVKKINIISLITQDSSIADQYYAVTGELLIDQLRQFKEPFADILVQVIKNQLDLYCEILASQTIAADWEFVFSLIFMLKDNKEMRDFVHYFDEHHCYKIENLINQVCRTKLYRRIFTALAAGYRNEDNELQDVGVIYYFNDAVAAGDQQYLQDLLVYILCSFSAAQIRIVLQSLQLEQHYDGECGYFFRNLVLWAREELVQKLIDEAMVCDEQLKIKRISMVLLVLRGKFDFQKQIGYPNFQEYQKTFVYEVMYRLWK